jgi:hypothetical protein
MPGIRPLPLAAAAAIAALALPARADGPPPGPGEAPASPPARVQTPPVTFDLGLHLGGGARIGSAPTFPITDRGSAIFGASAAFAPSPLFTVGVAYEHSTLGDEHGSGGAGDVALARSMDAVWATLRLDLVHTDSVAFGALLGPGLAWQRVSASVIVLDAGGAGPSTFQCAGGGSTALGLRAGLGVEARLGEHAWFTADALADNLHLSSDPIGTCAPGAGSTTVLGLRVGFVVRFDVSRYTR